MKRLDDRVLPSESRSLRLTREMEMFWKLLAAGLEEVQQTLSPSEAQVVLIRMRGQAITEIGHWMGEGLPLAVTGGTFGGRHDRLGVDLDDLAAKIRGLSPSARLALADWGQRTGIGSRVNLKTATRGFHGSTGISNSI
jgi:hypothetical protein